MYPNLFPGLRQCGGVQCGSVHTAGSVDKGKQNDPAKPGLPMEMLTVVPTSPSREVALAPGRKGPVPGLLARLPSGNGCVDSKGLPALGSGPVGPTPVNTPFLPAAVGCPCQEHLEGECQLCSLALSS